MAVYSFHRVMVWDNLGGTVRLARNVRVDVVDPGTGAVPTGLKQGGQAVTYLTADSAGLVEFETTDVPTVELTAPNGLTQRVTSQDALEAAAGFTVSEDAAIAGAVNTSGSASQAAVAARIDARLGGDATDLVPTVAGKADKTGPEIAGKVAKGDIVYRVADYPTAQAAIDAAPAGAVVLFPPGNVTITTPLAVNKAITLRGAGLLNSAIIANGCNAINIKSGMTQVVIESLMLTQAVPYTTTTNTFVGILIAGSDTAKPGYDLFRDLYIRGFQTAIQSNSLWSTRFERIYTEMSLRGIDAYGLSENNVVHACQILVGTATTRLAGSATIRLNGHVSETDTTADHSEGWIISDSILFNGDWGVVAAGYASYQIHNNIIDFCHVGGVLVTNDGTAAGGAATITGNYIALASDAAPTGGAVDLSGTVNPVRGSRIIGNELCCYGANAPYGIRLSANTATGQTVIMGNTMTGFKTVDIKLQSSNNIVMGNMCQSSGQTWNIYTDAGQFNLCEGNLGGAGPAKVFVDNSAGYPNNFAADSGGQRVMRGTAAPTGQTWARGDRVVNSAPSVGSPKAWVCTVAGTPGTWVSEGNL